MNQREFHALSAAELDPMAVVLYVRGFRRFMNFANGEVALSLSRLQQELEYHPPARSCRGKLERISIKRVRTLIQVLLKFGLIAQVRAGNAAKKLAAVYVCTLATTDRSRHSAGQIYLNEERHKAGIAVGHIGGQSQIQAYQGLNSEEGHILGGSENREQGHTSERSEIQEQLNGTGAVYTAPTDSTFPSGRELIYSKPFQDVFKRTHGFGTPEDKAAGLFQGFQFSKKNRALSQSLTEWLDDWRAYCGINKSFQRQQRSTQQPQRGDTHDNATGNAQRSGLEWCKQTSERLRTTYGEDITGSDF